MFWPPPPVFETSVSIQPNDNDLELNTISDTFSKTFQPEMKWTNFKSSSFADHELLSFVCFPLRGRQKTEKKKLSLLWTISLPSGGIQEHKTWMEGERKRANRRWSKTFLRKHCQNKTSDWLASLSCHSSRRWPSSPPYLHSVYNCGGINLL